MKLRLSTILFVLLLNFIFSSAGRHLLGQTISETKNSINVKPFLIDSFNREIVSEEDADSRIDNLSYELSQNKNSSAFIIIYCGRICSYGEVEAHLRGIEATLTYKKLDKKRFTIISGGFRETFTNEFWLVRENACPPIPTPTINISEVKFKGNFKKKVILYHFSGN